MGVRNGGKEREEMVTEVEGTGAAGGRGGNRSNRSIGRLIFLEIMVVVFRRNVSPSSHRKQRPRYRESEASACLPRSRELPGLRNSDGTPKLT